MAQPSSGDPARLRELAGLLRAADHLSPEAQQALADLVEELSGALPGTAASAQLAESAAHLAAALHEQKDPGLLERARQRLEEAALRAETEAPVATGVVRRLIDALANLGI